MAVNKGNNNIKKIAMNVIKTLLIKILLIALIIMLIIVFFTGGLYVIDKELFDEETDNFNNRNQGAQATVSSGTSGENTLEISTGISDEELIEQTEDLKQYCDMSEEEYKKFIIKIANVSLITQLPYFDGIKQGELNGIIKFYRESDEGSVQLSYLNTQQFDKRVEEYNNTKDNTILNYFKFNDDETIEIAYLTTETIKITTDDLQINSEYLKNYNGEAEYVEQTNDDGTITYTKNINKLATKKINYKQLVKKYTMPSDFLIALLISTEDGDFVNEIADLAYNSEINIGIYPDINNVTVQDTYEYVKGVRLDTEAEVEIEFKDYIIQYPGIAYWVDEEDENRNKLLIKNANVSTVYSSETLNGEDQNPDYLYVKEIEENGNELNIILTEQNNAESAKKFKTLCEKISTEFNMQVNIKEAHTWVVDLQLESSVVPYEYEEEQTVNVNNEEKYINISQKTTAGTEGAYRQSINKATALLNSAMETAASTIHSNLQATYNIIHSNISNRNSTEITNLRNYVSQYLERYGFNNNNIINQSQREYIYSDIIRVIINLNKIDDINNLNTGTESGDTADIYILGNLTDLNINSIEDKNDLYKKIINGYIRQKMQISEYTGNIIRIKSTVNTRNENIVCNTLEINSRQRYTYNTPTITENTDKFVNIFNSEKYRGARSLLLSADQWFYEYIEDSENTADMIDLVKYLLYKATNSNKYGDISFDFSLFAPSTFNSFTGTYGDTVEEKVWYALKSAGYSDIAVAAVMGNIKNESGFDSEKIESGNNIGFGLCQWSFGRRTALEEFATSREVSPTDVDLQIEFLLAELTPGGGAGGKASYQLGGTSLEYSGKTYTVSDWTDTDDIDTATMAFMALFERPDQDPDVNHCERRKEDAKYYYNMFKDVMVAGGTYKPYNNTGENIIIGTFTSGSGNRTFRIYNQSRISGWTDKCNRAAAITIASGFTDKSDSELIELANQGGEQNGPFGDVETTKKFFSNIGLTVTGGQYSGGDYRENVKKTLQSGKYVAMYINAQKNGISEYRGKSGKLWTKTFHWVAILGYRCENGVDQFFIADPAGYRKENGATSNNGWYDMDEFMQMAGGKEITSIYYISK